MHSNCDKQNKKQAAHKRHIFRTAVIGMNFGHNMFIFEELKKLKSNKKTVIIVTTVIHFGTNFLK